MNRLHKELMLLAAYQLEINAAELKESSTYADGQWDLEDPGARPEYRRQIQIVDMLRLAAGVSDQTAQADHQAPALAPMPPVGPAVITPVGPYVYWYDPDQYVPPPLDSVEVIWSACGLDPVRDTAYRRRDGQWVLDGSDPDMVIQPLAWTPKPQMPRGLRGVLS